MRSQGGSDGRSGKASERRPPAALPPASLQSPRPPPSCPCQCQASSDPEADCVPQIRRSLPGSRPQVTEPLDLKMAASAVRGAVALRTSVSRPVAFVRKIPWTAASSELREHFAQFGHVRKCTVPFDKETGFHRGMGWIQFSSEEELQNALQQENHILDGVKLHVQAQRPKVLQGDQTSDEEKDF
ncbi:hypothetical protein GH733_002206 [Mirounga leonina]|nr:hypothetical protein GH733_002206 [Mirounga leonina]